MSFPPPKIDLLSNHFYKRLCREEIFIILDEWLDVPVLADWDLVNLKLIQARRAGAISREELLDGLRTGIVAREAEDVGHTGRLAVVEASLACNRDSLEAAARRANLIAGATGASIAAFVVTHFECPDEMNAAARQLGVTIIRHEDPYYIPD